MSSPPAAWYADPQDPRQLRYWDGHSWTEHRASRTAVPPGVPVPARHVPAPGPTGRWYFVITIASAGILAAVPFFHAASRLDRPQLRKVGAGMAAGGLLGFALMGAAPTDDTGQSTGWLSDVAVLILLGVMVVATALLVDLRREVYNPSTPPRPTTRNQAARASVEESRRKREEARKLAREDPMMARELGIGRPDSRQGYDDGGLLELNHVTAEQLSAVCGLPRSIAEEFVALRATLGHFVNVEDAIVFGRIGEECAPMIRDRGIIVADR